MAVQHVHRVEGNSLLSAPDLPASPDYPIVQSTSALDTGLVFLETIETGWSFNGGMSEQIEGTTPHQFARKALRVNHAYYIHPSEFNGGCEGTITVTIGGKVVATIYPTPQHANDPGGQSAWDCVYSVDPGRAEVVLRAVPPGVTIKHRQGVSPHSTTVVAGAQAPGVGDFWAEGDGSFCQFEVVK